MKYKGILTQLILKLLPIKSYKFLDESRAFYVTERTETTMQVTVMMETGYTYLTNRVRYKTWQGKM